jgi:hypothetical protein
LPSRLPGLFIQTSDLGEQLISTSTNALGLHRHIPATLLFIQAAKPQIHLPMQFLLRMGRFPASNGGTRIDELLIVA